MIPPLRPLIFLAILWLSAGCEIDRVLTIKPDGSGQISERFLAARDSYLDKAAAVAPDGNGGAPGPRALPVGLPLPTAEFIAKRAAEFGEGVELVSFKKIEDGDMMGYEAAFEFPDVTKIHADVFLQQSTGNGPDGKPLPPDAARNFQFTKGDVSELRIPLKFAQKKKEEIPTTALPSPDDDPKQREAMLNAIKHYDTRMAIRVQGKIEETNSHFREDNLVVVNEMNMKGLFADPKYAQEIKDVEAGKTQPAEPPKDDRYIKDESVDELRIRFR